MSENQKYFSIAKLCDQHTHSHSHSLLQSPASPLTLCYMQNTSGYDGDALKLTGGSVHTRTEKSET